MTITRQENAAPALDAEEVFRFLGYNPNDPSARAVVGLCLRYQLDPFAGHIIAIPGRRSPYVTRDGHLWLAHRSSQFDGMETLEEWANDKNCYAKVAVWRKDMGHPFIYTGRCPIKNDRGGWDINADKKAVANAEVRALKRAFPLQLPSIVDYEDDLEMSGAGERRSGWTTTTRDVRDDPAPGPTTGSPSTLEPEASPTEADRSRVEGANPKDMSKPGDGGTPPPSVATAPPGVAAGVPRPQPPGGTSRLAGGAKGKRVAGRTLTDEEPGQAAFDHSQTSDPGRFAR